MDELLNIINEGKAHVRVEMDAEDLMAFSHTPIQRAKDELGSMVAEAQKVRMLTKAEVKKYLRCVRHHSLELAKQGDS